MSQENILILGVGNILLRDEGLGVYAIQYLQEHFRWPEHITLMDGGTQGLMLMTELQQCDQAIILDVVLGSEPAGTVYVLEGEDLRKSLSFRDSMHQMDLVDTLISCELAGHRPQAVVIGMQPYDYQTMDVGLSPQAAEKLPEFCRKALEEMARRGIKPLSRR